jgi:hypothetical protein
MVRARPFDTRTMGTLAPGLVDGLLMIIGRGPLDRSAADANAPIRRPGGQSARRAGKGSRQAESAQALRDAEEFSRRSQVSSHLFL